MDPVRLAEQTVDRAQLQALIARALETPAYASEWEGVDLDDWESLPLLTKERLVEASSGADPFGGRLAVDPAELAYVFVAAGPLYMPFTAADLTAMAKSYAHAFTNAGLTDADLVDQTTMYNWVIAATVITEGLRMVGCGVVPGGVGRTELHLDTIRALGVTGIVAFPTFLEHLLRQADAAGIELPLRKAVLMGELSNPNLERHFEDAYGLVAREFYGTADVGVVASECAAGQGMHLRSDLVIEFIDPATAVAALPEPGHPMELVVSDLSRRAMPIVRLRTGDLVDSVFRDACRCGDDQPRIARIVGRSTEITKIKGMFLVPSTITRALASASLDCAFQVIIQRRPGGQDDPRLALASPKPANALAIEEAIERAARMKIPLEWDAVIAENSPLVLDLRDEAVGSR